VVSSFLLFGVFILVDTRLFLFLSIFFFIYIYIFVYNICTTISLWVFLVILQFLKCVNFTFIIASEYVMCESQCHLHVSSR
jgi:hypothetical protein